MELEIQSEAYWETRYAEEFEILENQTEVDSLSSPALVLKPRDLFLPVKHSGAIDQASSKENQINRGSLNGRKRRLIEETDDEQNLFLQPPVENLSEIDRFFSGKRQRANIEKTSSYIDNGGNTMQDILFSSPVQNPIHSRLPKELTLQRSSSEFSYSDILDLSPSTRTFGASSTPTSVGQTDIVDEEVMHDKLIYPSDDEIDARTPTTASRARDNIESYTSNRFGMNHTTPSGKDSSLNSAYDKSERRSYHGTSPSKLGIHLPPADHNQLEEAKQIQGCQNDHIHTSPMPSSLQTNETNDDIPLFLHRTKPKSSLRNDHGPTSLSPINQGDLISLFPQPSTIPDNDNDNEQEYSVQRRPTSPSQPPKSSWAPIVSNKSSTQHKKAIDFFKPPEEGGFIVGKTTRGKTLYFPRVLRGRIKVLTNAQQVKFGRNSLISAPIYKLMEDLDNELMEKAKKASLIERVDDMDVVDDPYTSRSAPNGSILWAEKYRPQRFLDLTGDQVANKDVLYWLKEWDFCVFGRLFPSTKRYQNYLIDSSTNNNSVSPLKKSPIATAKENKDPLKRPECKILLLAGPPGLGKTTLAHIVAKHCDYNIIEINASDDRTGPTVLSKIKAATEMQAIVGGKGADKGKQKQKANCLIIDEIDGVSAAGGSESFIKILVNLATTVSKPEKEYGSPDKNRKKQNNQKPLLRPIICICNDQYAPVLRPLRQIAKIVIFKKVPNTVIARRLMDICNMEGLKTDMYTLNRLCDMTDGDIRSCLNTLQFMRDRSGFLTYKMLENSPIGKKDLGKGVFDIWEAIFQKESEKKKRESKIRTIVDYTQAKIQLADKYIDRLNRIISTNGDYDKLMLGCFESYPRMRFHDNNCQKLPLISEWTFLWDQINTKLNSAHENELYPYLSFPLIAFHQYCAGTMMQNKIGYPRQDYENFVEHRANENLVASVLSMLGPQRKWGFTKNNASSELLTPLLRIISPPLKPVNKQLLKADERIVLLRLVEVMISFNLSFVQERTDDGHFFYRLEPPIEKLAQFGSRVSKDILPNRYAARQLIAHEIDLELMRRHEGTLERKNTNVQQKYVKANPGEITQVKAVDIEQLPTDFFGRPIVINKTPHMENEKSKKPRMRYRYHEGFSNAVRKRLHVANFC